MDAVKRLASISSFAPRLDRTVLLAPAALKRVSSCFKIAWQPSEVTSRRHEDFPAQPAATTRHAAGLTGLNRRPSTARPQIPLQPARFPKTTWLRMNRHDNVPDQTNHHSEAIP